MFGLVICPSSLNGELQGTDNRGGNISIKTVPNPNFKYQIKWQQPRYNTGYCKYKQSCKFFHSKERCEGECRNKDCRKRHPKLCKFEEKCRRQVSWEYRHEELVKENKAAKSKLKAGKRAYFSDKKVGLKVWARFKNKNQPWKVSEKKNEASTKEVLEEKKSVKTKLEKTTEIAEEHELIKKKLFHWEDSRPFERNYER